jgi:hypothetical protein
MGRPEICAAGLSPVTRLGDSRSREPTHDEDVVAGYDRGRRNKSERVAMWFTLFDHHGPRDERVTEDAHGDGTAGRT